MAFSAQVITDSVGPDKQKLQTSVLQYPRLIHAEFMTHREFSRNASSSRAIPVLKVINQVRNDPAMPIHWGKNQPGMQAHEELDPFVIEEMKELWIKSAWAAAEIAEQMMDAGLHKQVANRVLEPYQWMHVVVTTASNTNFDGLRRHGDADPNIAHLAEIWHNAQQSSIANHLRDFEWHLPFIDSRDWTEAEAACQVGRITRDMPKYHEVVAVLKKVSAARCARVSYLNHEGKRPEMSEDIKLFERLVRAELIHASPTEHQARPDLKADYDELGNPAIRNWSNPQLHGNLPGWIQFRKELPNEYIR